MDIIEKLRSVGEDYDFHENAVVYEAADEITRLRQQVLELQAAVAAKDEALGFAWRDVPMSDYAFDVVDKAISIQPSRSALLLHEAKVLREAGDSLVVTGALAQVVSSHLWKLADQREQEARDGQP